jgi:hypothetical protein
MSPAIVILFNPRAEYAEVEHMLAHPEYHSGIMDGNHLILARTLAYEAFLVKQDLEAKAVKVDHPLPPAYQPEQTYVGDIEVELTGLVAVRQRRRMSLPGPLTQSGIEALAREIAGSHAWEDQATLEETIEVTILSQPVDGM